MPDAENQGRDRKDLCHYHRDCPQRPEITEKIDEPANLKNAEPNKKCEQENSAQCNNMQCGGIFQRLFLDKSDNGVSSTKRFSYPAKLLYASSTVLPPYL